METLKNPFLLGGYHSSDYFCDRESKLAALNNHLHNGRNVVLFSWRRMGKSALIKRFLIEKERSGKVEAVYVDLLASRNMEQAIELIVEAVYQRFGKTKEQSISESFSSLMQALGLSISFDPHSGHPKFSLGISGKVSGEQSLKSIGKFLQQRKLQMVIAIDEFQQVSRYADQNGEAVFRSFMQEFPQLRFIFSGSHRKLMTSIFADSKRPFYKSCSMMALGPIPKKAYFPFIQKHFEEDGRKISKELMERIYEWSDGQTYSIQLLCNRLYGSGRAADESKLNELIEDILEEESPVFSNYFHLLPKMQWKVLKAIAKERRVENPLSKDFLRAHDLGAASSVSTAIKSLEEKEMLAWEEGQYFVHDLIFSRWLEKRN
jgi:AAA+ ATPase superfamily predicted ATPase